MVTGLSFHRFGSSLLLRLQKLDGHLHLGCCSSLSFRMLEWIDGEKEATTLDVMWGSYCLRDLEYTYDIKIWMPLWCPYTTINW